MEFEGAEGKQGLGTSADRSGYLSAHGMVVLKNHPKYGEAFNPVHRREGRRQRRDLSEQ